MEKKILPISVKIFVAMVLDGSIHSHGINISSEFGLKFGSEDYKKVKEKEVSHIIDDIKRGEQYIENVSFDVLQYCLCKYRSLAIDSEENLCGLNDYEYVVITKLQDGTYLKAHDFIGKSISVMLW